jgi:hypothetical protein
MKQKCDYPFNINNSVAWGWVQLHSIHLKSSASSVMESTVECKELDELSAHTPINESLKVICTRETPHAVTTSECNQGQPKAFQIILRHLEPLRFLGEAC